MARHAPRSARPDTGRASCGTGGSGGRPTAGGRRPLRSGTNGQSWSRMPSTWANTASRRRAVDPIWPSRRLASCRSSSRWTCSSSRRATGRRARRRFQNRPRPAIGSRPAADPRSADGSVGPVGSVGSDGSDGSGEPGVGWSRRDMRSGSSVKALHRAPRGVVRLPTIVGRGRRSPKKLPRGSDSQPPPAAMEPTVAASAPRAAGPLPPHRSEGR